MATHSNSTRPQVRPRTFAVARLGELSYEWFFELALLTAVLAAVAGGTLALGG